MKIGSTILGPALWNSGQCPWNLGHCHGNSGQCHWNSGRFYIWKYISIIIDNTMISVIVMIFGTITNFETSEFYSEHELYTLD